MQHSTPPTVPTVPPTLVHVHLLSAFLLGLPIGPFPVIPLWLQWTAPVVALAAAMLISIQLDAVARQEKMGERARRASQLVLLVSGIFVAAIAILIGLGFGFEGLALIPLGVSLAVTFAVGSGGTRKLALGCGLAAWLGVSVHLLAAVAIIDFSSESVYGGVIIVLTAIEVIVGMVIAIPGALLGRVLRVRLLGIRQ
jgi:hypothetical protein